MTHTHDAYTRRTRARFLMECFHQGKKKVYTPPQQTLSFYLQRLTLSLITMSASMFAKGIAFALGGSYAERKFLPDMVPALFAQSSVAGLPQSYCLCLGSVAVYGFWLLNYSMKVGGARKTYMEKARKDGEKNVDLRYSLPNLYVEGNTKHSKAFNCVQRSHQQQLETIASFSAFVLIGGLSFPVTSGCAGMLYTLSRTFWAEGYAEGEGDASQRYSHPLSGLFWQALLASFLLTMMTCVETSGLFKFW